VVDSSDLASPNDDSKAKWQKFCRTLPEICDGDDGFRRLLCKLRNARPDGGRFEELCHVEAPTRILASKHGPAVQSNHFHQIDGLGQRLLTLWRFAFLKDMLPKLVVLPSAENRR
jgi:hypothetical protein